jgi:hypothetical protein
METTAGEFEIPSGAERSYIYFCSYEFGEKHKCDKYVAHNCKSKPEDCTKEKCQGGFYDAAQGHCKGCLYGDYDANIKICHYRRYKRLNQEGAV